MTLTEREKELILAHLEETPWVQTSEQKQMKTQAIAFIEELQTIKSMEELIKHGEAT